MHELSKLVLAKQQLAHASPRALASTMSTLALEGGFFSSPVVPASEATTRGNSHGEIVWSQDLSPRYHTYGTFPSVPNRMSFPMFPGSHGNLSRTLE